MVSTIARLPNVAADVDNAKFTGPSSSGEVTIRLSPSAQDNSESDYIPADIAVIYPSTSSNAASPLAHIESITL